jgi:ribosomal protein S18 acetylase RimI-like enzyme
MLRPIVRGQRAAGRPTVAVRDMAASDVARVAEIFRDAFNEIYERRGFGPVVTDGAVGAVIANAYRDLDPGGCVVVTSDGRIAGSGFVHLRGRTAGAGPITIDPPLQGAGVGRALMDEICRRADAAQVTSLRLIQDAFNETSFALYCRMGFVAREVLLRASFASVRDGRRTSRVRPAAKGDVARVGAIERELLGIDRPQDHLLLLRLGEMFLAGDGYLARIVRGGVAVLGPVVAASLDTTLDLIAAATVDLPAGSDVRMLVPARLTGLVDELLSAYRLSVHSLCTYMVRGEYEPFRGYYVPTLFPESG